MELWVNGEPLSIELENEENAFEVVSAAAKAIEGENGVIIGVTVDGKNTAVDDDILKDIPVDSIGKIELDVAQKSEVITSLLEESRQMLTNMANDIRTNGYGHTREFLELLAWVRETASTIGAFSPYELAETRIFSSTIKQLEDYLSSNEKDIEKIGALASIMENLNQYLDAMETKIVNDFSITREALIAQIDELIQILPEISEAFQTGKDREALTRINSVIEVLELCSIYIRRHLSEFSADNREEIENHYEEINQLLTRMVEAFENGDVVLLGDLMEYELPERLERYRQILGNN